MIDSIAATALIDKKESIQHRVESIFPTADQIPHAFRLQAPVHQREYLIDGELRRWEGEQESWP
jgi:glyceraldehyde-3-phosphate dehydrogenase (NADP+)